MGPKLLNDSNIGDRSSVDFMKDLQTCIYKVGQKRKWERITIDSVLLFNLF